MGSVIADFTVESVLGEGGMATVYRAMQTEPRRPVALKVIRADHAADPTYRARFLAEKDTLASLEHPSIVPIHAAGDDNGVLYIAMRLVDGPDLKARIAQAGKLNLAETVSLLRPIADAVDFAHQNGIVHRDLKPSNIMIDRGGRAYLTDFGLGKPIAGGKGLTTSGVALGTLEYMAPEQFSGDANPLLAKAVDLYALGAVAWTCLTGTPPFKGERPEQLLHAQANLPPPSLHALRPDLPVAVDKVIARALAKDPEDRYASASELIQALAAAAGADTQETETVGIPPPTSPIDRLAAWARSNTAAAFLGGALVLVLAVAAGAAIIGNPPAPTAGPSTSPSAAASSPAPTPTPAPPTPTPTLAPSPTLGTFPTAAESNLIGALPATANPASCVRYEPKIDTSTAMVKCDGPKAGSVVYYSSYPDSRTLEDKYNAIVKAAGIAVGGRCIDGIPANNTWQYNDANGSPGPDAGSLACYAREYNGTSFVQYLWTHDRVRILGDYLAPDNDTGYAFWRDWAREVGA